MSLTLYNYTDQEILEQLAQANKKVFDFLFDKHYTELCRFAYKYTGITEIGEEIVQDIFVYLWEKREVINITTSLKSYLYSAVKNRSINYLKSQYARQHFEDINERTTTQDTAIADEAVNVQELTVIIATAINTLPEKCRIIFQLSRNSGLTYAEIAEQLNLSKKTVEVQMGIALKKLRTYLGKHWDNISIFFLLLSDWF